MIYNEENVELHFAVAYQEVSFVHSRRRDCGMRQRKKVVPRSSGSNYSMAFFHF